MAGKSTVAAQLGECLQRDVIELDQLYRLSKKINGNILTLRDQKAVAKKWARSLVKDLCEKGKPCIIEGGWISHKDAAFHESQKNLKAIFCGYRYWGIEDRMTLLKDSKHWLARKTEDDQREFLAKQVADSKENENTCKKFGLQYVDFTKQDLGVNEVFSIFDCARTTG